MYFCHTCILFLVLKSMVLFVSVNVLRQSAKVSLSGFASAISHKMRALTMRTSLDFVLRDEFCGYFLLGVLFCG